MPEAVQDQTPQHSQGYGPAEQADETRQAQQQAANDVPVDVNPNAMAARTQGAMFVAQQETISVIGKGFGERQDARSRIFDTINAALAGRVGGFLTPVKDPNKA